VPDTVPWRLVIQITDGTGRSWLLQWPLGRDPAAQTDPALITDAVGRAVGPKSRALTEELATSNRGLGYARRRCRPVMSSNKKLIEKHLATTDRSKLGELLADDVEWVEWGDGVPPAGILTQGKEAFLKNYGDDELRSEIHRLTEENDVVVAEGTAHVTRKDGTKLSVRYVDIFEIQHGKIKRKSSFGALLKGTP